jgi:hypothetical protein
MNRHFSMRCLEISKPIFRGGALGGRKWTFPNQPLSQPKKSQGAIHPTKVLFSGRETVSAVARRRRTHEMAKIISFETRQRQLEARVQIGWAKVACSVLRSMAGRQIDGNPVEAMREFVELYDAAAKTTIDPKGIAIRMPLLDRGENDSDLHTNMIVRGSMRMVAARLEQGAAKPGEWPGVPTGPAYDAARLEVVRGIRLMQDHLLKALRY